jgi:succinoglycan biosynthesis protein ExoM
LGELSADIGPDGADVVVGVCTFNRPEQLRRLLEATADALVADVFHRRVDVLVVDDGDRIPARGVVEALAHRFVGRVHYQRTASANLATARNTVLDRAASIAPWLVMIDDDCVPEPDWLSALFEVQDRTDADVVTGHVSYRVTADAPRWLDSQPFCSFDTYEDASEPVLGTTANALIRTDFLTKTGVRFRSTLGRTGGEDMTFFNDVRAAGGRLRYSAKAVVHEELTSKRQTLRYHLYRQLWLGNNVAEINRHTQQWSGRRLILRGCRWIVLSWREAARRVARREPAQLRWTFALSLRGAGLVIGVLGVRLPHRA